MKMKTKLLAALVALVLALGAHAELCVSEICPKPKGFDPNGFESGWIELYNAGDEPVNLSSYTLERFNRGKAAKAGSYAALPDVTVPAKGYQVVYTSEEYPAAVNDGKTPFVYEGCVVVPFKVNPKKYPLVRLLKGADVLESFVVPVELDNDKSFAPAGGVFPEYTAPGVQPALPQPPAAVEIAVDPTKVTTDEAKGVTAVDAAASLAETNIWSLAFTFRIPPTEIPSVKTGYPLFNAPGAIYAYLDPDGQIEFQVGSANFSVDFDGIWTDNLSHTVQFVCGPLADSRIAIAVDGVTYVDSEVGVAAPLDATKSLLFGQITDAGEWMSFAGNISDVKLYTGSLIGIDYTEAVVSDENVAVPAAVTRVILPKPTKGAANNMTGAVAYGPNAGPLYGVKHALADWKAFAVATKGADYAIEMMVNPLSSAENDAIQNVTLVYRAFAAKDMTLKQLPMTVKTTGDKSAGTTYEATVPAADLPEAGGLLQWAAIVTDKAGNSWRTPSARSEENGYKWYGTIVEPTADQVSATLPTWHFFCEQDTLDNMDKQKENITSTHPNGVFCGIYDSQTGLYYDHVRIDLRGNTTAGLTKKSHSLKFLKCQPLTCTNPFDGEAIECRKTSMLAEYADPSRLRSCLSFYLRRQAGQDVPFCYPIRTQLNGKFYQLCFHTNRFKDELFEDYFSGYDPMGHAFKNAGDCDSTYCGGGVEQQLPDPDDYPSYLSEFNAFKSQFVSYVKKNHPSQSGMTDADRKIVDKVVVKDFDLPGWLNFLALSRLTQECDDGWSTLCLYYDVNRTGTWTPMAYDVHQSFGAYYKGDGYGVAGPWADNDRAKCHPYYGGMRVVSGNYSNNINRANRAYECIYQSPKFRRLMARRLRTLMDDLLKEPGTAQADTPFWNDYAAKLVEAMQADDVLDRQKWGLGTSGQLYVWSGPMSFADGVKDLWDNYIVKRRTHFFTTHSATNTAFSGAGYGAEYNAMLPAKQSELAVLKPQFEVVNQNVDGTFTDTEKLVIRNNNDEAVDLSGWKVEGVLKLKLPAGTVVDAKDTITIVSDRKAYVAKNDASLADQVIVGNAAVNADATTVALKAADGTEVVACAEPTDEAFYLRLHSFYGNTADGDKGDSGEWICLTNISPTAQLNLNGVKIEFTKQGDTESKCLFTITNDIAIAAGGSVTLKQKDYKAAGWSKITNNKLAIAITDRNGGTCQAGTVTQSNHPKADGNGAYLILNTTARSFTDEDFSESSLLFLSAAADVSGNAATVVATVDDLGEGATACDLYFACGPKAEELPAATLVASGLGKGAVWTNALEDLAFSTDYKYLYVASNNAPAAAGVTAGGTFATEADRGSGERPFGVFQRRIVLTMGGFGAAPVDGAPLLVRLSEAIEGFSYADCGEGGNGLCFADAEGNVIPHEIDTWDPTGESLVWVRPAALQDGATFELYYMGTPSAANDPTAVWAGYTGVWHLNELTGPKISTSIGTYANSTATKDIDGNLANGSFANQAGAIGKCFRVNDGGPQTGNYNAGGVFVLDSGENSPVDGGENFTISGWFKHDNAQYFYDHLFYKRSTSGNSGDYVNAFAIEVGGNKVTTMPMDVRGSSGTAGAVMPTPASVAQNWGYLTFAFDGTSCHVYANGAFVNTATIVACRDNNGALTFGNTCNVADGKVGDAAWCGWIDEVRFSKGTMTAAQIKAEYDAMASATAAVASSVEKLKLANPAGIAIKVKAKPESAELSGLVAAVGADAKSCTVAVAIGPDAAHLGEYVTVAENLAEGAAWQHEFKKLFPSTDYVASVRLTNDKGAEAVKEVAFTTPAAREKTTPVEFGDFQSAVRFTVSGYAGAETLTDYPVLVRLAQNAPEGFDYAECAAGGADIRFADAEGNVLAHEIETWNPNGESCVWVKVPALMKDTAFLMYYNGTSETTVTSADTWSAYTGVWHMDELDGDVADATGHGLTAKPMGAAASKQSSTDGVCGKARINSSSTAAGDKAYLNVPSYDDFKLGSTFTMSGWVKMSACTSYPRIFSRKANWGDANGWEIEMKSGSMTDFQARGAAQENFAATFSPALNAGFSQVVFVYNDKTLDVYQNGVLLKSGAITAATDNGKSLSFGSDSDGNETHIAGTFDEFRLADGCASADRIRADYDQLAVGGAAFLTASAALEVATDEPVLARPEATASFETAEVRTSLRLVGEGATKATVSFAYGTDASNLGDGEVIATDVAAEGAVVANLADLTPGTTYYYVFRAVNDAAEPMTGTLLGSFQTKAFGIPEIADEFVNGSESVQEIATVVNVGDGAASVDISFAHGADLDHLSAFELIRSGATAGEKATATITDFEQGVAVAYAWLVVSDKAVTNRVTGSFTPGIDFRRPDTTIAEYSRGVKMTVSGYTEGEALENFPVLVRLSEGKPAGFSYADFYSADGSDLVFIDAKGKVLAHEVDTWNPQGESLVWVQIPELSKDVEFSMWYRSSKPGSVFKADPMWAAYVGVWHLGEGGDGVQAVADSAVNALNGTTHANSLAQPNGVIGAARRVSTKGGNSGANGQILVELNEAQQTTLDDMMPTFTFSAWFAFRTTTGPDYAFLCSSKDNDRDPGWGIQFNAAANGTPSSMRVHSSGAADNQCATYTKTISKEVWYKMNMVWDGTTFRAYYDGVQAATGNLWNNKEAVMGTSGRISFGGMTGSGYGSFNGDMDEIRIRKGASSAAWVKAEYLNETTGLITSGEVVSFTEKPKPIGTLALVDFGAAFAQFGGSLTALGGEATAAEIQAKVWAAGDEEPAEWTTLAMGVTAGAPFSGTVTGLRPMTAYAYQIRAVSDLAGANPSDVVEGTFTTVGTGAAGQGGKVSLVGDDYVHVYDRHSKDLTFVPPEGVSAVELLLVGGGGAGGHTHGGGGAGGSVTALDAVEVEPGAEYAIEIGAGGIASAAVGTASTAGGATVLRQGEKVVAQATGGNAGGNNTTCDGGDNANFMGGVKNTGGNSGGGGAGAGQVGGAASNDSPPSGGTGGNGFTSSITGTAVVYGGGGGGGTGTQGTLTNPSSPGAGGLGGGGKGGGGNVAVEADAAPTAGQDGLGGGGGGGAVSIAAYLAGCNGGSGFAAIRYTMAGTGAGTAVPRVSIDSATYDGDLKITVGYRVGWAGEGVDKAAVRLLWGYAPTAITREVAVSEATIGSGSFVFSAPLDQTTYYFKVVASNAAGSDESDATLSVVVPKYDGDVPGDQQVPAFEGDVALGHADGHFATLEGLVKSLGEGAKSATVTGYIGLTDDVAEMTNQVAVAVAEGEPFAYPLTGLDLDTTYYCYVEVKNDLGAAISTPVMSFTTRSASALSTPAVTSSQNAVTLRGSLQTVGAGVTDVYVAWNGGAYEKVASFTGESESTEFIASYAIAEWKNVSWKVLCSNECVTVAGEPTGEFWTDLRQATQVLTDTATYTWKPDADGNWSGDWSDPAHWDSNKDVCLGYPNSASAAVTFANCTAANPVTVRLDKGYACGAFTCIGTAASDITFAGPGAANCTLTCGALPQKGAFKSGTKLAFRDLTFKSNNGNFVIAEKSNDVSGLEIVFSGVTVPSGSISQFVVAAPYSHVTFERDSSVIFGDKLSVGGTNSVLTVDDSAVQANPFYAPVDIDGDGMKLEIRGANPVLKSTGYFSTYANTEDLRIVFTVPEGGYDAAPIQMTGTLDAHKFALPPMAQGSSKYLIEFDPASPALAVTNEITDMVLVDTKKGFATDYMAEGLGIAPVDDKGAALGAYKLSEDGLKLLVTFRGYEHGGPWQDIENAQVEGVTDENKAAVEATLDAILDAIPDGDVESVAQYLTDAYGDQKVPAAKIANAKNIGLSVKYLIPLMEAEKPTIEVEADVENDAGFIFVIKDGATPVELNATKAKVREIVRFAADLATSEFAPDTTETEIAITVEGSAIKASFKKPNNETQGFMKAVMD